MVYSMVIEARTIKRPTIAFVICSFAPPMLKTDSLVIYLKPPMASMMTASTAATATEIAKRRLRKPSIPPLSQLFEFDRGSDGERGTNSAAFRVTGKAYRRYVPSIQNSVFCIIMRLCQG